jgi:hypothetical protein
MEYVYPSRLYAEEEACLDALGDDDDMPGHRIVLPPDLWQRVPGAEVAALERRLRALARLRDEGYGARYARARQDLAGRLGLRVADVRALPAAPAPLAPTRHDADGGAPAAA